MDGITPNPPGAGSLHPTALAALSLLAWQYCECPASANPSGGTVAQGAATFSSSGSQMTINSTTANTAISWQSFNVGAGETTTFVEPSSSSVVWNNIGGGSPSQIAGTINANGYVILQNQSGFAVAGSAVINAGGLVMTTAKSSVPTLADGGAWSFNSLPPAAQIINYGQINIAGGGSAFLIASDIENNGTISAPGGKIGLYAGEQVLVSPSPDGRSLSAQVTLPQGSVDNEGRLIADAGTIAAQAQTVNQNGLVQANSVQNINGVIELVAGDSLTLGASSDIEANGDPTTGQASPGGFVVLQAGNTFADTASSTINVAGQNGGPDGIVEILGGNLTDATSVQSLIDGVSAAQFGSQDILLVNPYDLTLSYNATDTSLQGTSANGATVNTPNLNISDLASYSQIDLHALDNIELSAGWNLPGTGGASGLGLNAGNNIILDDGSSVTAGADWNVNLTAGTGMTAGSPVVSGSDGIYLNGGAYISTQNGDINVWAANEVQIDTGASGDSVGNNGIRTLDGGNINVTAEYGDVNTGGNSQGFNYLKKAPYFEASSTLGGISTAAGGNVNITAGGDVISYLPGGSTASDGGSGAFGSEPGNVTITAGGNVYGHYVLVNGTGNVTAGANAGSAAGGQQSFALSLVSGTWNVNVPNGSIYLQEVRNPNGVFNTTGNDSSAGSHLFDYDPLAAVNLTAGIGVYLTDLNVPRPVFDGQPDAVQVIYPPTLNITAGDGGVTLQDNVTLYPSPYGNLTINTSGSLVSAPNTVGEIPELLMSDSAQDQWVNGGLNGDGIVTFGDSDHPATLTPNLNPDPVTLNIGGDMDNLTLITTKETQITVGGNMSGCGFSGQNLSASDVTSITVGGQIFNQSPYTFVYLNQAIPSLPSTDLLPEMANAWNDIFTLALNTASSDVLPASSIPASVQTALNTTAGGSVVALTVPPGTIPNQLASFAIQNTSLFPISIVNGQLVGANPGFVYNTATGRFGFTGSMSQNVYSALSTPTITVLRLGANGLPVTTTVTNPNGTTTTYFATDQVSWVSPAEIATLFNDSANAPSPDGGQLGYRIGGPGQFDVNAGSIDLGNTYGILSCGVEDPQGGFGRYNDLAPVTPEGATVNVTVSGDLTMLTSTIAAIGGGDVNVTSTGGSMDLGSEELFTPVRQVGFGIFTSGQGNVNVTAYGDVDIDGSRIAAFNGGNISVESLDGSVNVGDGGDTFNGVGVSYVNPVTGQAEFYAEDVFGSGIVANTLVNPSDVPGSASLPGSITVNAPLGNITSGLGGISAVALNRNLESSIFGGDVTGGAASIYLSAGSAAVKNDPSVGNINLGTSGVIIGVTVVLKATHDITGPLVIGRNVTAVAGQNFTGDVVAYNANIGAQNITGDIVGIDSVSVTGDSDTATLLGANVSDNGVSSQSALGTAATATSAAQSAANQSGTQAQQQLASNSGDSDDQKKKKKQTLMQHVKRVTVLLPDKT